MYEAHNFHIYSRSQNIHFSNLWSLIAFYEKLCFSAAAVEAGLLSYAMAQKGRRFRGGDGIVTRGVEGTIRNIGILAREGMRETDKVILQIMLNCEDE